MVVWTDSDHAGCKRTRRCTSGGVLMLGRHFIRSWSSTQASVAISSGEAEYYAMLKGASVALGFTRIAAEAGFALDVELRSDSSAGLGMVNRGVSGKVRHVEVVFCGCRRRWREERWR